MLLPQLLLLKNNKKKFGGLSPEFFIMHLLQLAFSFGVYNLDFSNALEIA